MTWWIEKSLKICSTHQKVNTPLVSWVAVNTLCLLRGGFSYLNTDAWCLFRNTRLLRHLLSTSRPDTGNPCPDGVAGWDWVDYPRTSQLAQDTCERATKLSFRPPFTIIKIRYLPRTQGLTNRHPSLAYLKLAPCVLPAVKFTFASYHSLMTTWPLTADLALCLLRNRDDLIQNKLLHITILNFG